MAMQKKDRIIFHCDNNGFYASVEESLYPELKKVPMAVCGDPESRRGIILAKNELAKAKGVKTAETIWQAQRKCPHLVLRPARHHLYREYCENINAIYQQYSPQVERGGIDESFIEMTGCLHLFGGDALTAADEIRERIHREIGVTISVGISWNKIFAKLGSDTAPSNAVQMITRENYKQVVWTKPVSALLMVGKSTRERLRALHIETIGDLANADVDRLKYKLDSMGEILWKHANGLDDEPVRYTGDCDPPKSIGNGRTFKRNLVSQEDIRIALTALCDMVAARMRRADMKCSSVQVTIKDTHLKSITRQKGIPSPTWLAADLFKESLALVHASWPEGKPIRMLTVTAQKLTPADQSPDQLTLFEQEQKAKERLERLEAAVNTIRNKFGSGSISHANLVKNDLGLDEGDDPEQEEPDTDK
jgi:DNA polymerase-4